MIKIIFLLSIIIPIDGTAQIFRLSIIEHRQAYKDAFLKEKASPVKVEDMQYFDFYEPDSTFRVKCRFSKKKSQSIFTIPTVDGKKKEYYKYGNLKFEINGKKLRLNVYRSLALMKNPKYKNYLFVPFKDLSSGKETYGGGRYLDFEITAIKEDLVILDFNKAYNPYCAFSSGFSCPIPPKENHLNVRVEAGEKNFKKSH